MMMRLKVIVLVQMVLLLLTDSLYAQEPRSSHSVNSNWAFHKGALTLPVNTGSVVWDTVSIPHTRNSEDVMDDKKGYYRGLPVCEKRQDT